MAQQLSVMHRGNSAPFLMINDAHTIQARALLAAEDWRGALDCYEKLMDFTWDLMATTPWIANGELARKVRRRNMEYMLNLGICSYKLGKYADAIQPLSCAVMMNRQSKIEVDTYRYLALTQKEIGDWEEVLKVITMAALYQPHCEFAGKETHAFFKEMLKDWYNNHRSDKVPQHAGPKIDVLQFGGVG